MFFYKYSLFNFVCMDLIGNWIESFFQGKKLSHYSLKNSCIKYNVFDFLKQGSFEPV